MNIIVNKLHEGKNSTLSAMTVDGQFFCYVLEDAYRNPKVFGESRIDGGQYVVIPVTHGRHYRSYSDKFGHEFSLHIPNVNNFSGIMIHIGNTVYDSNGCLLVGDAFLKKDGDYILMKSTISYKRLYDSVKIAIDKGEKITIQIIR